MMMEDLWGEPVMRKPKLALEKHDSVKSKSSNFDGEWDATKKLEQAKKLKKSWSKLRSNGQVLYEAKDCQDSSSDCQDSSSASQDSSSASSRRRMAGASFGRSRRRRMVAMRRAAIRRI